LFTCSDAPGPEEHGEITATIKTKYLKCNTFNMNNCFLFIEGGGSGGYEADKKLVASLQAALGETYEVRYPQMHADETLPDFGWPRQIGKEIADSKSDLILAGHSLGASLLLKYLSENEIKKKIRAIFLISTPFWKGNEDWKQGLKLHKNFPEKLPEKVPIFFYQCRDDEEVQFEDVLLYAQKLPHATVREIAKGGHQLNNDLTIVAKDIKSLGK
jgi:predicted alpha/beta hydrolase family esterase